MNKFLKLMAVVAITLVAACSKTPESAGTSPSPSNASISASSQAEAMQVAAKTALAELKKKTDAEPDSRALCPGVDKAVRVMFVGQGSNEAYVTVRRESDTKFEITAGALPNSYTKGYCKILAPARMRAILAGEEQ